MFRRAAVSLVLLALGLVAHAQTERLVLPAAHLAKPVTLDGSVDDAEWIGAAHHEGIYLDTDTGKPGGGSVSTWFAYDQEGIYFGIQVRDDPKSLVKTQYRANSNLWQDDFVELSIDPSGSGSSFCSFRTNPAGATSLYLAGGRAAKAEWQGSFRAKSKVLADGWSAEMMIPWKILPLPASGQKDVLVQVGWNDASDERFRSMAYTENKAERTPLWKSLEVPKIAEDRQIQLLPYGYAGYDQTGRDRFLNGGLDFKTSLGRKGQLVGTINPDFRNIENRVLGLGFSYFERLAGEARPFFLEGQDFLGNGTGDIFASQRIGSFDAGLKAYGKLSDKSNYALLATQDFGVQSNVVAAYENSVTPDSGFAVGLVSTQKRGLSGTAGQVGARVTQGSMTYSGSAAFTDDDVFGSGSSFSANINRSRKGVSLGAGYSEISPSFFPRLGYAPDRGYRSAYAYHSRDMQPSRGPIKDFSYAVSGNWSEKLNGDPYQLGLGGYISSTFKNRIGLEIAYQQSRFLDSIDSVWSGGIEFPTNDSNRRIGIGVARGDLARMTYTNVSLHSTLRLSSRLITNISSQWDEHYEKARQSIFSFSWDMGDYQDFGGRLIARDGKMNWHLTWRKAGKEGSEFFVILGDPNAPEFRRSLILKAVFPLSIKY